MNDLHKEIAELRGQNDLLRNELMEIKKRANYAANNIAQYFGVTLSQARILSTLGMGGIIPQWRVAELASVGETAVNVHISRLRRAIDPIAIITNWGLGYSIEGNDLSHIRKIMKGDQA